MGDRSTHVIFYSGYWYLVCRDHYGFGIWVDGHNDTIVCKQGEEERIQKLSEI